jgi:hypothetical protein
MLSRLLGRFGLAVIAAALGAEPAGRHWWEREPLRIVDVVTSFGQIAERPPEPWVALKMRQFYNTEHLEIMNLAKGLDDQGFFFKSQAAGKPRVIFSAAGHKPWTFSVLPEAELRLLYAGTIANAASVWFGMWPAEIEQPEMQALAEMNRFLARNAAYYQDTRSEAKVALVWSDTTANFYTGSDAQLIELERVPQRSEVGNLNGEFSGLAEALVRTQTPFDVIDDVTLEKEDLRRWSAIMLPNVACMSQRTADRLQEYVRQGGRLLATFETSLYDEVGQPRRDFALAEVFGVSFGGRIIGPKRWDFMKPRAAEPLLEGLGRDLVPAPVYHLRVRPQGAGCCSSSPNRWRESTMASRSCPTIRRCWCASSAKGKWSTRARISATASGASGWASSCA